MCWSCPCAVAWYISYTTNSSQNYQLQVVRASLLPMLNMWPCNASLRWGSSVKFSEATGRLIGTLKITRALRVESWDRQVWGTKQTKYFFKKNSCYLGTWPSDSWGITLLLNYKMVKPCTLSLINKSVNTTRSKPNVYSECTCSVQNHQSSSSPTCGRHICFCQSEAAAPWNLQKIQKIVNVLMVFLPIKGVHKKDSRPTIPLLLPHNWAYPTYIYKGDDEGKLELL